MNYTFAAISMAGSVIAGAIGVAVLAINPGQKINRLFFAFAASIALSCLFGSLVMVVNNQALAEMLHQLSMLFWFGFLAIFLHFCVALAKKDTFILSSIVLPAGYVAAGLMALVDWEFGIFHGQPVKTALGYAIPLDNFSWLIILFQAGMASTQLWFLYLAWRGAETAREKKLTLTIIGAVLLGLCFGAVTDVILPARGFSHLNLSPFARTTYIAMFGFALVRFGFYSVSPAALARSILDTMPDFLVFADPRGLVALVNKNYLAAFGFTASEVIGRKFIELSVKGQEMWLLKKSGEKVPVAMDASPVVDRFNDEIGRLHIFRDISYERKLLAEQKATIGELTRTRERILSILEDTTAARDEAKAKAVELAQAVEDLKGVDKMKNEFLSVISHELRTPITPIKGYVALLLDNKMGVMSPEQRRTIEIIARESDHLQALMDSILDVSRLVHGRTLDVRKEPVLIKAILDELLAALKPENEQKEIKVVMEIPADLPTIMADRNKLIRVFSNLLGNAWKFTPRGGHVKISGAATDGSVRIAIADDGIGIAQENQTKIFDKFYQVDSSSTREAGGVGLGLAIAKEIVEAHGGKIWVESAGLGKGSKFIIILPVGG